MKTCEDEMAAALWTKIQALKSEIGSLKSDLATERARRELAERQLEAARERRGPLACDAYADVAKQMEHLATEPAAGTPAWNRWTKRGTSDDWRDILVYCKDMARSRRRDERARTPLAAQAQGRPS